MFCVNCVIIPAIKMLCYHLAYASQSIVEPGHRQRLARTRRYAADSKTGLGVGAGHRHGDGCVAECILAALIE